MNNNLPSFTKKNTTSTGILKALLLLTNLAAITVYLGLRIIFTGFNISFMEDMSNLLQTFLTATLLDIGIYLLYAAARISIKLWQNKTAVTARKLPGNRNKRNKTIQDLIECY